MIKSALCLIAVLASAVTHAAVVVPPPTATCNGRVATQLITRWSQMPIMNTGLYDEHVLFGTAGNDVVVIDLSDASPPSGLNYIAVDLDGSSTPFSSADPGGRDYVCAKGSRYNLTLYGGRYLKAKGLASVYAPWMEANSYFESDTDSLVGTGNGENTIIIDDNGDIPNALAVVNTGSGNDTISIATNASAIVESGKGDDTINILLRNRDGFTSEASVHAGDGDDLVVIDTESSNSRSFVVGGKGMDTIVTGDGADLVYGSDVSYSGDSYRDMDVTLFERAAHVFKYESASVLRPYLTPLYSEDTDGGDITTNGGNDYIYGTNGTDYLRAGGGNDWVKAYGARDRIWGGSGNDSLAGGGGDDDVYGENGDDRMDGNDGNDLMKGGRGNDTINGGANNDTLYGNEDDDAIDGGSGTDSCSGDAGDDTLAGCP